MNTIILLTSVKTECNVNISLRYFVYFPSKYSYDNSALENCSVLVLLLDALFEGAIKTLHVLQDSYKNESVSKCQMC